MNYQNADIRRAVEAIFDIYADKNQSSSLGQKEIEAIIEEALQPLRTHIDSRQVEQMARKFIERVDTTGSGRIDQPQLFGVFKYIIDQESEE